MYHTTIVNVAEVCSVCVHALEAAACAPRRVSRRRTRWRAVVIPCRNGTCLSACGLRHARSRAGRIGRSAALRRSCVGCGAHRASPRASSIEHRASSIEHRAHARHLSCHGDGQMVVERSTSRERRVQQPTPRQPRARPPARATPCPPRCCAPLPRGRHSGAPPQWPCPWRAPPPRGAVCRERPPPPARRPRLAPPRRPCPSWSTTCGERWGR